jgi:anti-sigma regulatory factor (Ser/Thr protein kinase)
MHTAPLKSDADPGFYLRPRPQGFAVHILASQERVRRLRALIGRTLHDAGVDGELTDNVQLVASELVGNAIRACGDSVPLVVETYAEPGGVRVTVHDPERDALPRRPGTAPDDDAAESGRGLFLLDLLAPGWQVEGTPIGKQVRCLIPPARTYGV